MPTKLIPLFTLTMLCVTCAFALMQTSTSWAKADEDIEGKLLNVMKESDCIVLATLQKQDKEMGIAIFEISEEFYGSAGKSFNLPSPFPCLDEKGNPTGSSMDLGNEGSLHLLCLVKCKDGFDLGRGEKERDFVFSGKDDERIPRLSLLARETGLELLKKRGVEKREEQKKLVEDFQKKMDEMVKDFQKNTLGPVEEQYVALQKELLRAHLKLSFLRGEAKPTVNDKGLHIQILKVGQGERAAKKDDRVSAKYTGWLLDGSKFDGTDEKGKPAEFELSKVIKGWTEGLEGMRVGEKRRLYIPPELGYGERGAGSQIPPNSYLMFEVELVEIK